MRAGLIIGKKTRTTAMPCSRAVMPFCMMMAAIVGADIFVQFIFGTGACFHRHCCLSMMVVGRTGDLRHLILRA